MRERGGGGKRERKGSLLCSTGSRLIHLLVVVLDWYDRGSRVLTSEVCHFFFFKDNKFNMLDTVIFYSRL